MKSIAKLLVASTCLLASLALAPAVLGATASDTDTQASAAKPGEMLAKGEILEVTRVGDRVAAVKVRTDQGEATFVIDAGTAVRRDQRETSVTELKTGDHVDVAYRTEGEQKIALRIELAAHPKS